MDTGGMEVRSHSPGSLNEENQGFLLIVRRSVSWARVLGPYVCGKPNTLGWYGGERAECM